VGKHELERQYLENKKMIHDMAAGGLLHGSYI